MKDRMTIPLMAILLLICANARPQSISGVVNAYFHIVSINTANNSVTLDDASGLGPDGRVLLYQAKGATIASANNSTFGDISALNSAGHYEFNTICSITGNEVVLKAPMLNTYESTGSAQLVSIPVYTSVTIGGTVTAAPWDPVTGKGGIVVIEASGNITLNADIDVSGLGFQGGTLVNYGSPFDCLWAINVTGYGLSLPTSGYYTGGKKGEGIADFITNAGYGRGKQANGGGGGNNLNTGGGGGGNAGVGGTGGQRSLEGTYYCHGTNPGIGGLALTPAATRIYLGGGGGSGHEDSYFGTPGGNGGGLIILTAASITGSGSILANGSRPQSATNTDPYQAEGDGGGGGGAGGAIILNAPSISGTIAAEAKGAAGSNSSNRVADCTGPGGGGGGGSVWLATGSTPAGLTIDISGGANGIISTGNTKPACAGQANGATPGTAGTSLYNYIAPQSTGNTCVPLALDDLLSFDGAPDNQYFHLDWSLTKPAPALGITSFDVQHSDDRVHFQTLATVQSRTPAAIPAADISASGTGSLIQFHYTDSSNPVTTQYYRLTWIDRFGHTSYSRIVVWNRNLQTHTLRIYPNPVTDLLHIELSTPQTASGNLYLYSALGQPLQTQPLNLHPGLNTLTLSTRTLPAASYFLITEINGRREIRPFFKKN